MESSMSPQQHIRLAIAALTGRPAQAREVYRAAFALACLVRPLLQVIDHGYGRCGVEVERGRYQRWLISLKGPPKEALAEEEPERVG
jgi:hypothetical protein